MKVANEIYDQSEADGRERGAYLFRNRDGTIRVGEIKVGEERAGTVDLGPAPEDAIGEIHTHPNVTYPSGFILPGGPPSGNDANRVANFHHYSVVVTKEKVYVIPWNESQKAIEYDRPQQER